MQLLRLLAFLMVLGGTSAASAAPILFIGDSITAGTPGVTSYADLLAGGDNRGHGGWTTTSWINNFSVAAAPYLEPNQTVHILLGANDSGFDELPPIKFRNRLLELVGMLFGDGRTIYISPPYRSPTGPAWWNDLIDGYATQVNWIWSTGAAQPGAPLWALPPTTWDGVHPDQAGHQHIASLLAPVLGTAVIPEPTTALLFATGLLELAARRRGTR